MDMRNITSEQDGIMFGHGGGLRLVFGLDLGEIKCSFPIKLVGGVVLTKLSMVVPPIHAWAIFADEFW